MFEIYLWGCAGTWAHPHSFEKLLQSPASLLQCHCNPFAAALQHLCSSTAMPLQRHCKRDAVFVQCHCRSAALLLQCRLLKLYVADYPLSDAFHALFRLLQVFCPPVFIQFFVLAFAYFVFEFSGFSGQVDAEVDGEGRFKHRQVVVVSEVRAVCAADDSLVSVPLHEERDYFYLPILQNEVGGQVVYQVALLVLESELAGYFIESGVVHQDQFLAAERAGGFGCGQYGHHLVV